MTRTVRELAQALEARILGDDQAEITGVASLGSAAPGDLVFVEEEKDLQRALASSAAAVIAGDFAEAAPIGARKPVLVTSSPRLAFARSAKLLGPGMQHQPGVHPSAVVPRSAELGEAVAIAAGVVLEEGVRLGDRTWVGAGSSIAREVVVGADCRIYPHVAIYSNTRIGSRVVVHAGAVLGSDGFGYVRDPRSGEHEKFPQVGRLEIEDDVEIGANSTIDRGALETTRIGRGTKIDNLVHIGHNCQIGEQVIIAAQAGFSGSIEIGDNVIIGGQVGIGEHARIESGVLLGGQSGVLPKKILRGKGVAFWGTPATPLARYLRSLAALAALGRRQK
jgi:UDP-3-O-[3-hydroxymyristoyl] glucosamine N-acyltransferase